MPRQPPTAPLIETLRKLFAARLRDLLARLPASSSETPARLLLGCSAGGDSMALLDLAVACSEAFNIKFVVVHLDHAQRPESVAEADAVIHAALANGLEMHFEKLHCKVNSPPLTEDAMRQARHAVYRRAAEDFNAAAILLAHQLDDQAETLMIRLLAGSGPTGLGGMRDLETIDGLTILRPLLTIRRAQLRDYLRARGLSWHDDPTNDTLNTKRGWLRNKLLPQIASGLNLDPAPHIASAAELIAAEADATREATQILLRDLRSQPPGEASIAVESLLLDSPLWRETSGALRRQLLREWLAAMRPGAHPPGRAALESLLAFAERGDTWTEHRTVDLIYIVRLKSKLLAFAPEGKGGPSSEARHAAIAELRSAAAAQASTRKHLKKP